MRKIIGQQIDDGPREYLVQCPVCGDMIDMRDLAEVIDHDCGPRRPGKVPEIRRLLATFQIAGKTPVFQRDHLRGHWRLWRKRIARKEKDSSMKRLIGYLLIIAAAVYFTGDYATAQTRRGQAPQALSADSAKASREASNAYLAQELAEMQRRAGIAAAGGPSAQEVISQLVERMTRLRDTFKDNPYVGITGFAVNIGIPPSVSLNVEFK